MTTEKKSVDWELIEKHYRAGILSNNKIAAEFGITEGAIRKRAKRDDWSKAERVCPPAPASKRVVLQLKDEMLTSGFVYVVYIDSGLERIYKIGMSKRFAGRLDEHQCASPFDICVAVCYFTGNMRVEEQYLHQTFADKHVRGEWFRLNDADLREIAMRSLLV